MALRQEILYDPYSGCAALNPLLVDGTMDSPACNCQTFFVQIYPPLFYKNVNQNG